MPRSLRGVRSRVERVAADVQRQSWGLNPAELVARLQAARLTSPADRPVETDEEIRARGRALRARLREDGLLNRGFPSLS